MDDTVLGNCFQITPSKKLSMTTIACALGNFLEEEEILSFLLNGKGKVNISDLNKVISEK